MLENFNDTCKHIYFLGIGGISMSGLAEILKSKGFLVSGSDIKISDTINHLINLDIPVAIGHKAENITNDIDLLVYTAAVKQDNPEIIEAKKKNISIIDRAELLGQIMRDFKKSIAISGTHGKTTTTSMVSEILLSAETDPTISIGGILPIIDGNTRIGQSDYFIAEACEYFDSFLKFNPFIAVILNIEADHLDYFKNLRQVQQSFKKFASRVPNNGTVVINKEIDCIDEILVDLTCHVVTYSAVSSAADWYAEQIVHESNGKNSFDAVYKGKTMGRITLNIPGDHNIANALAACAASYSVGISLNYIIEGLGHFQGVNRRFQHKGVFQGVTVVDDYAHHPTEIMATLAAAKKVQHKNLWCVFQPHTFSRTKAFFPAFSTAFTDADHVIVADIYAAREKDTGEISAKDLADSINKTGTPAKYVGNFQQIADYLKSNCQEGDLLITMGAGDVYLVGESVLND